MIIKFYCKNRTISVTKQTNNCCRQTQTTLCAKSVEINYICSVKRFLSYSLVYLSLLVALMWINMYSYNPVTINSDITLDSNHHKKSSISCIDFTTQNYGTEHPRIDLNSLNGATYYKQPVFSKRIIRLKKIIHEKYCISILSHSAYCEIKQQRGFYLYQLCKILI